LSNDLLSRAEATWKTTRQRARAAMQKAESVARLTDDLKGKALFADNT
jgi:hypothetical protein